MAERRMFAKTIIDSDAFLDMPLSAQAMYFHLSMRADDEGFVNNPKKIQRMIGGSDDELKLLIAKNFIIPFESGVVVIKHWRIHNYIRSDRLVETKYKDEKSLLELKDNGAYTIRSGIQEIEKMDSDDARKIAYKNSTLPYSFSYKIKMAFDGKKCPVCGRIMTTAQRISTPSVQHNMPISKGGVHELENISVICNSCNASIRDNETDELNNAEVIETWDKIVMAEKLGINWFWNKEALNNIDVSQMSVKCQSNVSIGKDSIDKDSIDKININNICPKNHQKEVDDLFDSLWKLYIRKEGKSQVNKKAKEEIFCVGYDRMKACIEKYAKEKEGTEKKYILMGSTFFNGRYKDYLEEPKKEIQTEKTEPIHEMTDEEWETWFDSHTN